MVSKQTVTLANSIVGVSVLAMPFCFKQCGIVLATLMLILGAIITRTVCYFLLKAGTITRRRNYEMLAWHTFGQGGKFLVEITIIGFLFGTLIAFFVVMGDLGPEIVSEIFEVENNYSLRNIIMAALCLFVALPLGLLRNIDSLSSVSTASVLFYFFLVFKILSEGVGPLISGSYLDKVDYWRPAGVLQCIPIFSMALSCQTQIFGIYESLPDPSLHKMHDIVKQAVTICTIFYFCVGFFGYIAFSHVNFGGNILMTFAPSGSTQLIKICFLMSIVFSVPLVVFPCRASLHSLIFRRVQMHHSLHDLSTNYIPDGRLKFLTIVIIGLGLITGILIPNIELVLGLVGSTTGTVICIIFPSIMFIRVTSKLTTERLLAQVIFFTGVITMIVSTYATLYAAEQQAQQTQSQVDELIVDQIPVRVTEILKSMKAEFASKPSVETPLENKIAENHKEIVASIQNQQEEPKKEISKPPKSQQNEPQIQQNEPQFQLSQKTLEQKQKPLQSKDDKRVNVIEVKDKEKIKMKDKDNSETRNKDNNEDQEENLKQVPIISQQQKEENVAPQKSDAIVINAKSADKMLDVAEAKNDDHEKPKSDNHENQAVAAKDIQNIPPQPQKAQEDLPAVPVNPLSNNQKDNEQTQDKDDNENNAEDGKLGMDKDAAENFLKTLKEHEESQKKLLEEQRQILAELKEHHEQDKERQEQQQPAEKSNDKNPIQDKPLVVDNIQNAPEEEIKQEEKLIKKLSKNIEKGKENAEIIEKIEEGLNQEIDKMKAEAAPRSNDPDTKDKIKMPEPQPPPNDLEQPILVGDNKIGDILNNVNLKADKQVQDPLIRIAKQESILKAENNEVENNPQLGNRKILGNNPKPIPMKLSEQRSIKEKYPPPPLKAENLKTSKTLKNAK